MTIRRYYFLSVLIFTGIILSHCDCSSSSSLSITANPKEIPADGISSLKITAYLEYDDSTAPDGTNINFLTTDGSFDPDTVKKEAQASTIGGYATIDLYSSTTAGEVTVTASFTTPSGKNLVASVTVKFVESAGANHRNMTFTCSARNIGALDTAGITTPIQVRCDLEVRNAKGTPILRPRPTFITEAGSVKIITPDNNTDPEYYIYTASGDPPVDVDPLPGEPSVNNPEVSGVINNPRDGLATICAVIKGEEGFDDLNNNGKWDSGEPFDDISEPFVDANDNGEFDNGELYIDTNSNGKFDGPNGRYDRETDIWKCFKILWSGAPYMGAEFSNILPTGKVLPAGASQSFTLTLVDKNLNPIAFDSNYDYISIEVDNLCSTCIENGGDVKVFTQTYPGMSIRKGLYGDDVIEPNSFDKNRKWTFKLKDKLTERDPTQEIDVTITAKARYTPAPKADNLNYNIDTMESQTITATCKFQAGE
ncbi:MAG: Ig-like domain-containing protein [Myxococcota bacterium]